MAPPVVIANHGTISRARGSRDKKRPPCPCVECLTVLRAGARGDGERVPSVCWCALDIVMVTYTEVRALTTRTCGRKGCQAPRRRP